VAHLSTDKVVRAELKVLVGTSGVGRIRADECEGGVLRLGSADDLTSRL
jgi:hypothetical protein